MQLQDERQAVTGNKQGQFHNRGIHSEFEEHSQNLLEIPTGTRKGAHTSAQNCQGRDGLCSEFLEPLRHLLGTMNVGKSRVEAADHVDPQSVPLTGYEHFPHEVQAYPVMVQPTVLDNSSALLDLPNVQTNLPPPLTPQQPNPSLNGAVNTIPQATNEQGGTSTTNDVVSNSAILESIQNITKVMQ